MFYGLYGTIYIFLLFVASAIAFVSAFYLLKRENSRGAISLALSAIAAGVWSLGYGLELTNLGNLPQMLMWAKVQYLGIPYVSLGWLLFALNYCGYHYRWPLALLLTLIPITSTLMALSNDAHHLLWTQIALAPEGLLGLSHGPFFWVQASYSYSLFMMGSILLFYTLLRSPKAYRAQLSNLIVAASIPIIGNIIYLSGLSRLDLSPLSFNITALAMFWGVFRYKLLDLIPLARSLAMEQFAEGMLVLDPQRRIVDINKTARKLFQREGELLGQPLQVIFPQGLKLLKDNAEKSRLSLGIRSF
ncbi:MAG: histidine kinase N-terminal 7TM domain-containing protein [Deinococcales bacterium]